MKKATRLQDLKKTLQALRRSGKPVCLVPTMGFLHEGHLSLVRAARRKKGILVVSLYVNPLQFGPKEDYKHYPRNLARDARLLQNEGVDLLFAPGSKEMVRPGFSVRVTESDVSRLWCGAQRQGHFTGVLTVVSQLFHLIRPQTAYFGQKDFQQLFLIRKLAQELFYGVEIKGVKTVREADGLALSSRNVYLKKGERQQALVLVHGLAAVQEAYRQGEKRSAHLKKVFYRVAKGFPLAKLQYLGFASGETLKPVEVLKKGDVVLAATTVGKTRLIDNWIAGGAL